MENTNWYILLILITSLIVITAIVISVFVFYNYKSDKVKTKAIIRAELTSYLDIANKKFVMYGNYLNHLGKVIQVNIFIPIKEILSNPNHKIWNKNLIQLLQGIQSEAKTVTLKKLFHKVEMTEIPYVTTLDLSGKSYFFSLWYSSFNTKTKRIHATSNALISNLKDRNFVQSLKYSELDVVPDEQFIFKIQELANKFSKKRFGIIKISVTSNVRTLMVASLGLNVELAAVVQHLNKSFSNIKFFLSNTITIHGVWKLPSGKIDKDEIENLIREEYVKFANEGGFTDSSDWLMIRSVIISNKSSETIDETLSKLSFEEHSSVEGYIGDYSKLPEILSTTIIKTKKEINKSKLKILSSTNESISGDKFEFVLADMLPYEYNLIMERTSILRIELTDYLIQKSIKLAKKNSKNNYIFMAHFSNAKHIHEKNYNFPKNLIISFSVKNIEGELYYDQIVNLRNLRKSGKDNYAFVIDRPTEIISKVIQALVPKLIFITNDIMEQKKFDFDTEFHFAEINSFAKLNDKTKLYILK